MHIITRRTLNEYAERNAQVQDELNTWFHIVDRAEWDNLNDLHADFPSADLIGDNHYVFNIKGNHYRLIALVFFRVKRVYIRGIYTHAEYSKLSKKDILKL
jgi:mRNA interferase HigB